MGSQAIWASKCVWMSTNPGVTILPAASISRLPLPFTSPTATMRSPCTATSPWRRGAPVPSTIMPFRMTRSYAMASPC